ncbi:hypothetical protein TRFO_21955 [Tritrichomonas foetus]|uniref:Uncharacterized protein n=1 Tax=Tritrichomonas foetus TaxID=1144522 RepID=A0A1J4KIS8_9EUKA|nr:hypothetical protein TRFO_21955 [Tritrichomonas foetus]|eukprot:OHT09221.1 hypothetical protein TRFO_21955 [Tritrichomonas foetus]
MKQQNKYQNTLNDSPTFHYNILKKFPENGPVWSFKIKKNTLQLIKQVANEFTDICPRALRCPAVRNRILSHKVNANDEEKNKLCEILNRFDVTLNEIDLVSNEEKDSISEFVRNYELTQKHKISKRNNYRNAKQKKRNQISDPPSDVLDLYNCENINFDDFKINETDFVEGVDDDIYNDELLFLFDNE